MANDFAKVAETSFHAFHERSNAFRGSWEPIVGVQVEQKPTISEGLVFGLDYYDAQSGTTVPTAVDLDSAKSTTSMAQFEKKLLFKRSDYEYDLPGVAQQGAALAEAGWATVTAAIWDQYGTLDSTAHPFDAESWITDGAAGTAYCADSVQIDPPNQSAFTQVNLQTTALSDSAVTSSLALLAEMRGYSGLPVASAELPPYLVYAPANATAALDILNRNAEIGFGNNSGTAVKGSVFGPRLAGGIMLQGPTTYDDNDWFLVRRRAYTYVKADGMTETIESGPIRLWLRTAPEVNIEKTDGANTMSMTAYLEYALIIGHGVSMDLVMHSVS